VKTVRTTVSFRGADGRKVSFKAHRKAPAKTEAEVRRRTQNLHPALQLNSVNLWRKAHGMNKLARL